ncbi:MAG: hypothetical protein HYT16_04265 [DPANN group archaeon]|nr:hypothetical protein [DPANN group archaeon]
MELYTGDIKYQGQLPPQLKNWRGMLDSELEAIFSKCPEDFQADLIRFLSATELNLQSYLKRLELKNRLVS